MSSAIRRPLSTTRLTALAVGANDPDELAVAVLAQGAERDQQSRDGGGGQLGADELAGAGAVGYLREAHLDLGLTAGLGQGRMDAQDGAWETLAAEGVDADLDRVAYRDMGQHQLRHIDFGDQRRRVG